MEAERCSSVSSAPLQKDLFDSIAIQRDPSGLSHQKIQRHSMFGKRPLSVSISEEDNEYQNFIYDPIPRRHSIHGCPSASSTHYDLSSGYSNKDNNDEIRGVASIPLRNYEDRRNLIRLALATYHRKQQGAARTIINNFRPRIEERQKRRTAATKIIQALRERVVQQKAARTIQQIYRQRTPEFCDYVFKASVASGMNLEEVLSRVQEDLEECDYDMEHDAMMEELSCVMEDKAARKIQAILRGKLNRGKAMDELCDAMLEGVSQAGFSCEDILSIKSQSEMMEEIFSRRSGSSAPSDIVSNFDVVSRGSAVFSIKEEDERDNVSFCEVINDILDIEQPPQDDIEIRRSCEHDDMEIDHSDAEEDRRSSCTSGVRNFRERRAAIQIVGALQQYRQRNNAVSLIQRNFRRRAIQRTIQQQATALLERRRRRDRENLKACGG